MYHDHPIVTGRKDWALAFAGFVALIVCTSAKAGDCNNDGIADSGQLNGPCIEQPWLPDTFGYAADTDCTECCCTVSIIADNFLVFDPTTFTGIRWWGWLGNTANEQTVPQNFTINIRPDGGGAPSTVDPPLFTYSGASTGRDSNGVAHYFEVVLDTPFVLPAGTHWIEIYNNSASGSVATFYWQQGEPDPSHSLFGSRFAVTNPPVTYFDFGGVHYFSFQLMCEGANDEVPPGGDGVPDDCLLQDCNGNGQLDADEIVADPSIDCDTDGTIDSCQSACFSGAAAPYSSVDCNCNAVPDGCEAGTSEPDCNVNSSPDSCDTCVPFTINLSNSDVINNQFLCNLGTTFQVSRDNHYARCFKPSNEGACEPFEITSVRAPIRTVSPGLLPTELFDNIPITITIYEDQDGCPPVLENVDLIPVVSIDTTISAADQNTLIEVPMPPTLLNPDQDYALVISVPDQRKVGGFVSIGMNGNGASGPTYWRTDFCELTEYETLQSQGAPGNRVLAGLAITGCYPDGNDGDNDGIPTECETIPPPPSPTVGNNICHGGSNNGNPCSASCECPGGGCSTPSRYLSTTPANAVTAGGTTSIQVEVVLLGPPFAPGHRAGEIWWAGAEQAIPNAPNPALRGAPLLCEPTPSNAQVWTTGPLHLFGPSVVPGSRYKVRMCEPDGSNCSDPLLVGTGKWGDVRDPFGGGSQPNFADVNAIVQKFGNLISAPDMPRVDLVGPGNPGQPNTPNHVANFSDISNDVSAFSGFPYPFAASACP